MNGTANPKVKPLPAESHVPGVVLRQADFAGLGAGVTPFRGGLFTVAPQCTSRPDKHAVRECWMIANGGGVLEYQGSTLRVEQGDVLLFEPHHQHQIHNDGVQPLVISTVWWNVHAG